MQSRIAVSAAALAMLVAAPAVLAQAAPRPAPTLPAPTLPAPAQAPVERLVAEDAPATGAQAAGLAAEPGGSEGPLAGWRQVAPGELGEDGEPLALAATLPGFADQVLVANWSQPVGVTVGPDGVLFVWEKLGRVWRVIDGVKQPFPFLDISAEVGNWGDHGLLGFALDPDFAANRHVYLLYAVDHHHLEYFGTPQYSAALSELNVDTIGRIARYTAAPSGVFAQTSTRLVLLGETAGTGIPICGSSHGVGWLAFGADGTLLVSTGDGGSGDGSESCLSEGIIQPKENVGFYRSQLVDSLSGKLLRLDRATGDGVPGNPWYDPLAPRAARSRVFALGLRNPARFAVRPGSGSRAPGDGDPGTIEIGDVGADTWEELNVVTGPGQNFGWPVYEGLAPNPLAGPNTVNKDAPNPIFDAHGGCPVAFFTFHQLLAQDSLNGPAWIHPCPPQQPIVTSAPLHVHRRPSLAWIDDGDAYAPAYDGAGLATTEVLGAPGCPVEGPSFAGNCSIGGAWSQGEGFPAPWQDAYFHADYGRGWIRGLRFDAAGVLLAAEPFAEPVGRPVSLAWNPNDGSLLYIDYTMSGVGALHRIVHISGNLPPVAAIATSQPWGPAPHEVAFDAAGSSDPEAGPLAYRWDFGDGTPASALAAPRHVFPSEDVTALGEFHLRVLEMDPPGSSGFSNHDLEVLRDGDQPPAGTSDDQRQYDTIHASGGVADKFGPDWVGYTFASERSFVGLLFQEGMNYNGGGFFDPLPAVQVRQGGEWTDVPGAVIEPPYTFGALPHYETFELRFPPVTGDGLRLYGEPGGFGTLEFLTVGELRVVALPEVLPAEPLSYEVSLTVFDEASAEGGAAATVHVNDTPPVPLITSPAQFSVYSSAAPEVIALSHASEDAESGGGALTCAWQVVLHHNTHTHPGPIDPQCASQAVLLADHGCGEGVFYYEVVLEVTDPMGLSARTSHWVVADCDRNLNGEDDAVDIASGASLDLDGNGIPDEAEVDCDGNGLPDLLEIIFMPAVDRDGNGVIDACQTVVGKSKKLPL